eukprot:SAG31_NODE_3000_length_4800_cov_2.243352_2_plen_74_part_00
MLGIGVSERGRTKNDYVGERPMRKCGPQKFGGKSAAQNGSDLEELGPQPSLDVRRDRLPVPHQHIADRRNLIK